MDQYDRVIHDIEQKTKDGVLRWKPYPPSKLSDLDPYVRRVESAYWADYSLAGENFRLLFIERFVPSFDEFRNEMADRTVVEVLVLGGEGEVALKLYGGVVEYKDLLKLSSLLEGYNDSARTFFDAFERENADAAAS